MVLIRPVRCDDFAAICAHRHLMFAESGVAAATLDAMAGPFAEWLERCLQDGSYFGFVAEADRAIVAGIGMRLIEWPPGPLHPVTDRRGYILNVFVEPAYRSRGIATELMTLAEEEFRRLGVAYEILHATEMGRRVYKRLGWVASPEMGKVLG